MALGHELGDGTGDGDAAMREAHAGELAEAQERAGPPPPLLVLVVQGCGGSPRPSDRAPAPTAPTWPSRWRGCARRRGAGRRPGAPPAGCGPRPRGPAPWGPRPGGTGRPARCAGSPWPRTVTGRPPRHRTRAAPGGDRGSGRGPRRRPPRWGSPAARAPAPAGVDQVDPGRPRHRSGAGRGRGHPPGRRLCATATGPPRRLRAASGRACDGLVAQNPWILPSSTPARPAIVRPSPGRKPVVTRAKRARHESIDPTQGYPRPMSGRFTYSRWDGTQVGFELDADSVLEEITDDLLYHGDLNAALRRMMQSGFQRPQRRAPPGHARDARAAAAQAARHARAARPRRRLRRHRPGAARRRRPGARRPRRPRPRSRRERRPAAPGDHRGGHPGAADAARHAAPRPGRAGEGAPGVRVHVVGGARAVRGAARPAAPAAHAELLQPDGRRHAERGSGRADAAHEGHARRS